MSGSPKVRGRPTHLTPDDLDVYRRLLFIGLAESDFSQAHEAATAALKLVKRQGWVPCATYLGLAEVALIRYARPFLGNRLPGMKGKAALPLKYLPQGIGGAEAFHESAMNLRHQYGAHSDMTQRNLRLEKLSQPEHGVWWRGKALCAWLQPPDLHGLTRVTAALVTTLKAELSSLADQNLPAMAGGETVLITGRRQP